METFISNILTNVHAINWEGPGMFALIVLTVLALFKKWQILLITLFTIALGWGAQDIIVMNLATNREVMSLSLIVYCAGGGLAVILSLISFFRMAL